MIVGFSWGGSQTPPHFYLLDMKDWTGNKKNIFSCIGANNHSKEKRASNDYYATDPIAAKILLQVESDLDNIWEPACGEGHLATVFNKAGKLALSSDLINRGYGDFYADFLQLNMLWIGDIVTNPPYKSAVEFILKALSLVKNGHKVCMFLKLTFLEGKERKNFFKQYPPKIIYVSSSRIICAANGNFKEKQTNAVAYAWYVWEKGYKGDTIVKWIN